MKALLVLVALATASPAVAQQSPELERAMRDYVDERYAAAAVGFFEIAAGRTPATPAGVERAEMFVGKALYRLELYSAAAASFDRLVDKGQAHRYYAASLKWYIALARELPIEVIGPKLAILEPTAAEPLNAPVRDELQALLVRHELANGARKEAADRIAAMPASSPHTARARLDLAIELDRIGERAAAEAAARASLPHLAADRSTAQLLIARATGDATALEAAASDALLADETRVIRRLHGTPLAGHSRVAAPLYVALMCKPDGLAETLDDVRADLDRVERYEDNAERAEVIEPRESLGQRLIARALAPELALLDSLDRQLAIAEKIPAPWVGSELSVAVLQELTLQHALAESDLGKRAGPVIMFLRAELARIDANRGELPAEACGAAPRPEPRLEPPPPGPNPRKSGCAGCASGGPSGEILFVLLAIGWIARGER